MPNKPIIGITPRYHAESGNIWMNSQYTHAVLQAGGIPVILEQFTDADTLNDLCRMLDGIIFTGGVDLHPHRYGEEVLPICGAITEVRDAYEFAVYAAVKKYRLPILGICRGIQFMNVAEGGTLYQDIDSLVEHAQPHKDGVHHTVYLDQKKTRLSEILGAETTEFDTNSYHHQAVKQPAPTCIVSARTGDGVIEAIEKPGERFWIGVQWHPEFLLPEDIHAAALFRALITSAAAYHGEKI